MCIRDSVYSHYDLECFNSVHNTILYTWSTASGTNFITSSYLLTLSTSNFLSVRTSPLNLFLDMSRSNWNALSHVSLRTSMFSLIRVPGLQNLFNISSSEWMPTRLLNILNAVSYMRSNNSLSGTRLSISKIFAWVNPTWDVHIMCQCNCLLYTSRCV